MTRALAAALLVAGCATAPPVTAPVIRATASTPAKPPSFAGQQPLGARARPFAQYITAMHHQIHKLFTLGFLAEIDARHDPAYADAGLCTQLRITVKPDGAVDHVQVRRSSGLAAFDTAAIDSVTAAAPFPPTPEAIRSADGKVYVDWEFHRDQRSCATLGVDPYIFASPANGRADYLAAVHRHIHERFTPFLAYLDSNRRAPPLDDKTLWTNLDLGIAADGTLARVDIARPSGVLAFDVAVLDTVMSAAPLPPPPAALLGADGLFRTDWPFHRDERACDPDVGDAADPLSAEKALQ